MSLEQFKTQILLLHSEQSALDSFKSGFNESYTVHCATSGTEALNTLGDTPIHVIVSAQDLPGMSGLDALREARKRSPDTVGILLAGRGQHDDLEAMVGDKEVFQVVRGEISPQDLHDLIEQATKRVRMMALAESANDRAANVDEPVSEHIVMETLENGSTVISDGTGRLPVLKPEKIQAAPSVGGRAVDILVLTKDEEFLVTIRDSSRGLHTVHHAQTPSQAAVAVSEHHVGVLVTDAAMVGANIEILTQRLRAEMPRLVTIVAGRRDDGEMLMDLINRGQVYRFLLKPVSPGRARLAIEASVKHHLDAPDTASRPTVPAAARSAAAGAVASATRKVAPQPPAAATRQPAPQAVARTAAQKPERRQAPPVTATPFTDGLDDAFTGDAGFTATMTDIATSLGRSLTGSGAHRAEDLAVAAIADGRATGDTPPRRKSWLLAVTGAVLALAAGAAWMFGWLPGSTLQRSATQSPTVAVVPSVVESEVLLAAPAQPQENLQAPYEALLEEARLARDAGQLITPRGSSAIELFVAARDAAPDDAGLETEIGALLEQVLSLAETALLDQRDSDAAAAIAMVRLAAPDNPRLTFLDAQLNQLQRRQTLEQARAAIRDNRFEDAAALLRVAVPLSGTDTAEIDQLAGELAAARSAQRIEDVLALAGQRLEQDRLTSPSNDNARYYYELALSNDKRNTTARQGLAIVAGKLVLRAREAIDRGQLVEAGYLLEDARALDAASEALAAASLALENAARGQSLAKRQAAAGSVPAISAKATSATTDNAAANNATANSAGLARADDAASAAAAGATPDTTLLAAAAAARTTLDLDAGMSPAASTTPRGNAADIPPASTQIVGINALKRIKYVPPKYPRNAMRRGVTGMVDIRFTVGSDGRVYDVTILESTPGTVFDQAAIEAVEQWQFEPPLRNGQAVAKRTAVRMAFNLQ